MSDADNKMMAAGLDHPCRETCSGWEQGRLRGEFDMKQTYKKQVYDRLCVENETLKKERDELRLQLNYDKATVVIENINRAMHMHHKESDGAPDLYSYIQDQCNKFFKEIK